MTDNPYARRAIQPEHIDNERITWATPRASCREADALVGDGSLVRVFSIHYVDPHYQHPSGIEPDVWYVGAAPAMPRDHGGTLYAYAGEQQIAIDIAPPDHSAECESEVPDVQGGLDRLVTPALDRLPKKLLRTALRHTPWVPQDND